MIFNPFSSEIVRFQHCIALWRWMGILWKSLSKTGIFKQYCNRFSPSFSHSKHCFWVPKKLFKGRPDTPVAECIRSISMIQRQLKVKTHDSNNTLYFQERLSEKILDDILNFIRKMYIVKWRNMGKVSSHISCPMPCLVTSTGENRPLM